jgi:hypothetical protein
MGEVAKRLHRKLASKSHHLPTKAPKRRPGDPLPGGAKDIPTLIKEGCVPLHAVYAFIQQMSSQFAEVVAHWPEMKAWAQVVERAEDEYMPAGPPMSPLTGSYFWMWALYDLRIGTSKDTLSSCQIAANDIIQLDENQLNVLKTLDRSRMGIYEHLGKDGSHVRLMELITEKQFICHCTSGYIGKKGELWYVRVVPPLDPELGEFWVTMTTPYVLVNFSKSDWIAFLKRTMLHCKASTDQARLHKLLKYGLDTHYWNEFVFKAYCNHRQDAVFLTGIPDMEATLPHA